MKILKNYNLIKLNTFGVSIYAKFFVLLKNEFDLKKLFLNSLFKDNKKLFLGGGSNILFTKDFDGMVVLNKIKGIEILKENKNNVFIKAYSGEKWNDLVSFSVSLNYWGIENLSFIPGSVGAAPVQNIGAYGVEIKDVFEELEALDIKTGEKRIFKKEDCDFGYRDSVFKKKYKDKYFILSITLKLSKIKKKNIIYSVLKEYLKENKIKIKKSKDVSTAVETIRRAKLPDPIEIGNAGSFFKNVFVKKNKLQNLLSKYPDMPYFKDDEFCQNSFPQSKALGKTSRINGGGVASAIYSALASSQFKIPAGWLIEKCGLKGYRKGNVGVHQKHALVLVNYGGAKGKEIEELALFIIDSVENKFNLKLIPEVNLI